MNVCKFCGAGQQGEDTLGYQCASWRYRGSDIWMQSAVCQQRSLELRLQHEQTIEVLQKRVAAAVKALKTIDRYSIEGVYDFGAIGKYDYGGDWVHFEDLDSVRDILQGNSPENQEGSE